MKSPYPRIIFSINTGRSGSSYLASLMKGFNKVDGFHEPNPSFCGVAMRDYQLGNKDTFNSLLPKKIDKINKTLKQNKIYFESNHYFIKGFGWEIMDKLSEKNVGIIILKREPDEIIKSFFTIGVSILGNGAVMHLIHPFSVYTSRSFSNNRSLFEIKIFLMRLVIIVYNVLYYIGLKKRKNFKIFKNFQYKYLRWYIDQYEYLKQEFIERYPDLSYLEIDINKMSQDETIKLIQNKFGLNAYYPVPLEINSSFERLSQ